MTYIDDRSIFCSVLVEFPFLAELPGDPSDFVGIKVEPKQRAHSPPKVPPISMAGGLAARLASELKIDAIPYGRRFPVACCGELQLKNVLVTDNTIHFGNTEEVKYQGAK